MFSALSQRSSTAGALHWLSIAAIILSLGATANAAPLATYRFGRGWATFGLALPQGAAKGGVAVGMLPTQTDIKTKWPDGSIRFAVVTAKIDSAGSYPINEGTPAQGTLTPSWPRASVSFTSGGKTYVADLPPFNGADSWLSAGSLVREARVLVAPKAQGAAHPLLQVIFDVRSYASGGGDRVDITVQNVQDVTAGGPVTYDVAVSINNAAVYKKTGVVHPYLTRWRKLFPAGALAEAAVTPDFEPFYLAGAVPRFLSTVGNPTPSSSGGKFDLLQFGDMMPGMGSPGGRPEIAPYPNWIAQYLVHRRPEQRAYMLAHADLSGSWAGHITRPDGLTLVDLDAFPTYWLDGRAGTNTVPTNGLLGPNATRAMHQGGPYPGGWSEPLETAHMPSLAYVPYLVTGDRYYLDQMKFWANFTLLKTWDDGRRQGGKGILAENQPRGIGWAIRNIADAAAYTPDADRMHNYFRIRLQTNLDYFNNMGLTEKGGPFEFLFIRESYPQVPKDRATSLWMNSYIAWALDHAAQQGFGPVAAMRDRIVRTQILFFNSDSAGYPRQPSPPSQDRAAMGDAGGAPYYPTVGRVDASGVFHFFTTMKEVHDASWIADPRGSQFAGYYGPEARLMLQIGVREGMPGAQAALDYLTPYIAGDVNFRSGWAIDMPAVMKKPAPSNK